MPSAPRLAGRVVGTGEGPKFIVLCQQLGCGSGGEGGIRTPDTLAGTPHFECGAFNHSATSPRGFDASAKRPPVVAAYVAAQGLTGNHFVMAGRSA